MDIEILAPQKTIRLTLVHRDIDMCHGTNLLGIALLDAYVKYITSGNSPGVTLELETSFGGAFLCRAIWELYKIVAMEGTLSVKGFPKDYLPAFVSLGLGNLPNLKLIG
jgi:hypothetical protein